MLSLWESANAVKGFAGEDVEVAKYYDFDRYFLIEIEPHVDHYRVYEAS
ncbi:MAG TPA: hypothetical protein VME66_02955 [Candidatus Acidoferrales bacterium]|nr:hypothetical protein [Candidatus Acidoferrales bacterium]